MSVEDVDRAQFLADKLEDIDEAIQEVKDAISDALSGQEYEELIGIKTDLLRDRQALVEQLEEIGLEDPDL